MQKELIINWIIMKDMLFDAYIFGLFLVNFMWNTKKSLRLKHKVRKYHMTKILPLSLYYKYNI
jgi:hypothetical protein